MPLNVTRFCSIFLMVLALTAATCFAQNPTASPDPSAQSTSQPAAKVPTAADVMRDRIAKSKAFIVVRNYPAAIYELENIKRETNDPSVNAVVNVLLMNSYLEQGDYRRANEMLKSHYDSYKRNNANAALFYQGVAGQVVKGARSQVDRFRALGLAVSDRNLPLEAVNEIEAMRGLVELVIEQTREAAADRSRSSASVVMLEEAMATRAAIARDDYDERRWRDAASDAREQIAGTQSVVINATDGRPVGQPTNQNTVAASPASSAPVPTPTPVASAVPPANLIAATEPKPEPAQTRSVTDTGNSGGTVSPPSERPVKVVSNNPASGTPSTPTVKTPVDKVAPDVSETGQPSTDGPLEVGSLLGYATSQSAPNYPATARQMRATGVVRVNVVVDENGQVSEIQSLSGHALLQPAARDAIRRWRFKPFTRDGQPVKATGFVNFNFSL